MTHKNWWYTEGSAIRPLPNEDIEEFAKRITEIAWSNGEFVEREACAKVCETLELPEWHNKIRQPLAQAIRARGEA
jgi:hypothetical protein